MKKSMQFSYYAKIIVNIVVYLLFFVYLIGFIMVGEVENKAIWVAVCVVVGLFALLYEILRFMFDGATKALVFDSKPEKAISLLKKIDKIDVNRTFRTSTIMMRLLSLIDMRDFAGLKEAISAIENEKDAVKNDYDVNLVKEYASMIMYGETHDKGKMKTAYRHLVQLKDTKTKKGKTRKGVYFFNWDVVSGTCEYYDENFEGACRKFMNIETDRMNKREAMHYYIVKADALKKVNRKEEAEDCFEKAIKLAQNNQNILNYISSIR